MKQIVCLSLLVSALLSAQGALNFTGVWELNKTKEPAGAQVPDNMTLRIDRDGSAHTLTIRVNARGAAEQVRLRFVAGEETKNEMRGAPMTIRAELDSGILVLRSVMPAGGRELHMTQSFKLSPDGNSMTLEQRSRFGSEPEREERHSFDWRPVSTWEPDAPSKPAEEVYKNIQIMKGVPAPRLQIVMANLNRWLGVECSHCHVGAEFEKDDKPAKQTARKMFQMVRTIGQEYFPGSNPVTCWTCHRGAAKPASQPLQ